MNEQRMPSQGVMLLAVDGSPSATSAAYAAAQIASVLRWRLQAMYVIDIARAFDPYSSIDRELKELGDELPEAERRMTLFEDQGMLALMEIKDMCEGMSVPITTEMVAGSIPYSVLDSAPKYDLLALGRRGNRRESDDRRHLGGNFRQIAHHSPIPLLIGDTENAHKALQRILLAYDGSEYSVRALTWVERMQKLFSHITVISCGEETDLGQAWMDEREKEIAGSALTNYEFIGEKGQAGDAIATTASSRQADLIVMGSYHHSQILEWARHSILNAVLQEVDLPILAVK